MIPHPLPKHRKPIENPKPQLHQMACCRGAKRSIPVLLNELNTFAQLRHGYSSGRFVMDRGVGGRIQNGLFSKHLMPVRRFSTEISGAEQISRIKLLRERTSAPMKDVKISLVNCNWDIEEAQKDLRKRGVVLAMKKSSRAATEGLLAIAQMDKKAVVVELNCETDFVARNDIFQYLASSLANLALTAESPVLQTQEAFPFGPEFFENIKINLDHPKLSGETTVQSAITEVAAMVGENVKFRRGYALSTSSHGVISTYLHSSPQPGLGRMTGLLTLEVEDSNVSLDALKRDGSALAMHIVASRPLFLSKDLVSTEALESELEILRTQAASSGKPQIAIEKMVEGRLRKYMEEVVLLEQVYFLNDKTNIKSMLSQLSKEVGSPVRIGNFHRMEVGEGIQRAEASEEPVAMAKAA